MEAPRPRRRRRGWDTPAERQRHNVAGNWALGTAIAAVAVPCLLLFAAAPFAQGYDVIGVVLAAVGAAGLLALVAILLGATGLLASERGRRKPHTAAWGIFLGLVILALILGGLISISS